MRVRPSASQTVAPGVVLLLLMTAPLFAQSTLNSRGPAQNGIQAREWALTHIPDEVNKHFQKEQTSLFAQIREDFRRLQIINNEMMRTVFVDSNVDRKLIAVTTAEINKRATRLSANLALPKKDDEAKNQKPDDARSEGNLQAGLLALDHCIMSFVANPLFKQPNVVDSQNALKARSDLDLIIRLSGRLKKNLGN
jgi:hypothetical protein